MKTIECTDLTQIHIPSCLEGQSTKFNACDVDNIETSKTDLLSLLFFSAIKIDKAAGDGVTKLKQRYPSITAPTDEVQYTY